MIRRRRNRCPICGGTTWRKCRFCEGTGRHAGRSCPVCDGTRKVRCRKCT